MLPKTHIILGFIFSIIIFLVFPEIEILGFLIIWASSVLIDVDHYLFYVWLKKDWSLRNAYKWFIEKSKKAQKLPKSERKKILHIPCLLHGIEAILILVILSLLVSRIFLYILIGFLIHEFLDFIHLASGGWGLRHIASQTWNLVEFRKRKQKIA